MAINPEAEYPGRIEPSSPEYPYGAIRDESIEGAEDGTPLQQSWARDIQGFFQALLTRAAIVPSGDPDTVLVSDYMDALTGEGTPIIPLTAIAAGGLDVTVGNKRFRIRASGTGPSVNDIQMDDSDVDCHMDLTAQSIKFRDETNNNHVQVLTDFIEYAHSSYGTSDPARSMEMDFDVANTGWSVSATDGWYPRSTDITLDGIASGTRIKSVSISFKTTSPDGGYCGPVSCKFNSYLGWSEITEIKACTQVSPALGSGIKLHVVFDPTDTSL